MMLEHLLAGQSVTVKVPETGRIFQIRPHVNAYRLPAYDVLVQNKRGVWYVKRGYNGLVLGRERLVEWLGNLEAVTM